MGIPSGPIIGKECVLTQTPAAPPEKPVDAPKASGEIPLKEHLLMVNDLPRGQRYLEAMQQKIRPGDIVLEIGTGAGLLSCLAARLGAGHVYTVEQNPVLYRIAGEVVAVNGLSDKITLINAHSRDLKSLGIIEQPIDVFVTETIGAQGLDEGIATVFDDVTPFLSPEARVIPETVKFKLCLVNMAGIREQAEILRPILGVDMSPLNQEVKSNNLYWMHPIEPWRELSTTAETPEYDLRAFMPERSLQELEIIADGNCDGMLVWAEFKLADGVSIETRYRYFGAGWANSIHFMPRCLIGRAQRCISEFTLHDDRIGWSLNWTIEDKNPG